MFGGKRTLGLIGTVILLIATVSAAAASTGIPELQGSRRTGNVIFIHPDGAGLNHWSAARIY
jgi:alkaline phosphatase